MARTIDFPVFDGDNHLYETREALTTYLPEEQRGLVTYVEVNGRTKIATLGQISDYIPNPTFDVVAAPGAQEDFFRNGNPEGKSRREIMGEPIRAIDAFREPGARLALMDQQGLDRTMMYPTLASLVEERFSAHPDATHTVIHAVNQWLHDVWSFDWKGRIFTTPIITLPIVEKAIEELNWAVERGARAVLVRPAPVPGLRGPRSFALPEFDPFWQRVVETDTLVVMHASDSGYARQSNDWEGPGEFLPFKASAFRAYHTATHSPAGDAIAALACHGTLSRFPQLRVASVENGSDWVAPLIRTLAATYKKMPQEFAEHPVDAVHRCVYINPFWEDDVRELAKSVPLEHIVYGSDFPHPEGLADPLSYVDHLDGFSPSEVASIMGGTLSTLMKVS
ncbi:MAG TPA: amidohydrolase family protein [Mycobacteriales bacterium]|jgi:predicted TIM-barrel fold metal-dependent hydrolase|nr:amidohydrolase family protein [Mycobacteriales bacterium]